MKLIDKLNTSWFTRMLLPVAGALSLIWFLIRVLPKPSRATYPCQRAAFPLASTFVIWLFSSLSAWMLFKRSKDLFRKTQRASAVVMLLLTCIMASMALSNYSPVHLFAGSRSDPHFEPSDLNQPVGQGKGVFPGRVVWVRDSTAAKWDGQNGNPWDDESVDAAALAEMFSASIQKLSGEQTDAAAWEALIRNYNQRTRDSEAGFQPGEKIAVKLNNNCVGNEGEWRKERSYITPELVYILADQLINVVGFSGRDITFYDGSRSMGDPGPIIEKIRANPDTNFQNIQFKKSPRFPGKNQTDVQTDTLNPCYYADDRVVDSGATYFPRCVTEADYLINIPNFKAHTWAGITGCAKNHFGSVCFKSTIGKWKMWRPIAFDAYEGFHGWINPQWRGGYNAHPMGSYNPLVELMGHKKLGGKTLLYLVDAIFSAKDQGSPFVKFESFNDNWPSSLFISQDGVAIESVVLDFLRNEPVCDEWVVENVDNYLHEAAQAGDPSSGSFYDPENDGIRLSSLGVHEHWNNAVDKQYSKNLGTGEGIELVSIDTVFNSSTAVGGDQDALAGRTFILKPNYPNPFNPSTRIGFILKQEAEIGLDIYNSLGQKIKMLLNGKISRGSHELYWNGTDERGAAVPSGLYIYRIEVRNRSGSFSEQRKMILIK